MKNNDHRYLKTSSICAFVCLLSPAPLVSTEFCLKRATSSSTSMKRTKESDITPINHPNESTTLPLRCSSLSEKGSIILSGDRVWNIHCDATAQYCEEHNNKLPSIGYVLESFQQYKYLPIGNWTNTQKAKHRGSPGSAPHTLDESSALVKIVAWNLWVQTTSIKHPLKKKSIKKTLSSTPLSKEDKWMEQYSALKEFIVLHGENFTHHCGIVLQTTGNM